MHHVRYLQGGPIRGRTVRKHGEGTLRAEPAGSAAPPLPLPLPLFSVLGPRRAPLPRRPLRNPPRPHRPHRPRLLRPGEVSEPRPAPIRLRRRCTPPRIREAEPESPYILGPQGRDRREAVTDQAAGRCGGAPHVLRALPLSGPPRGLSGTRRRARQRTLCRQGRIIRLSGPPGVWAVQVLNSDDSEAGRAPPDLCPHSFRKGDRLYLPLTEGIHQDQGVPCQDICRCPSPLSRGDRSGGKEVLQQAD